MKSYETAMNQYQNLQRWLAHYNQVLRSRPRVDTRHKDLYQIKTQKEEKNIDNERKDQNKILLNRLIQIQHRPRKSLDDTAVYKLTLKSEFREKQRMFELQRSNLKFYNKLKAVKSSVNRLDAKKDLQLRRRQRFSQTLHYQGQVYKTFTDFMKSNFQPQMHLRTQKDTSKKSKKDVPMFKVQVVQQYDSAELSRKRSKRRSKKKIKKRSKHPNQQTQPFQPDEAQAGRTISSRV